MLPIDSFSKEVISQEENLIKILTSSPIEKIPLFESKITLGSSDEHKRAILNSELYGHQCLFSESISISRFYELRKAYDLQGVAFDEAIIKVKNNRNVIRAYNKQSQGKEEIYVQDYLRIMTKGCGLYNYIEEYNQQKEKREAAKRLQQKYHHGFVALYGGINLDTCLFSDITTILTNEQRIKEKDHEVIELEKKREELQRQREEKVRRRQELQNLKSCVSSWPLPNRATINCFSLYFYYPIKCSWEASDEEWEIRNLIWDFKANPHTPQSESEIKSLHESALKEVLPNLKRVIEHFFGCKKTKLTLVCIPSSKRIVTERRYKDLSDQLCSETGMSNGYPYISVDSEGDAHHLGGTKQAVFSVDPNFFKNRYVIIFDDVITTGKSMERLKILLESVGANVIGGLSIGKTKHDRQGYNPIDSI